MRNLGRHFPASPSPGQSAPASTGISRKNVIHNSCRKTVIRASMRRESPAFFLPFPGQLSIPEQFTQFLPGLAGAVPRFLKLSDNLAFPGVFPYGKGSPFKPIAGRPLGGDMVRLIPRCKSRHSGSVSPCGNSAPPAPVPFSPSSGDFPFGHPFFLYWCPLPLSNPARSIM